MTADRCRRRRAPLLAALLLAACDAGSGVEGEIRQRFAEKYDRPLCFKADRPFPALYEANAQSREALTWLSSLEHAGLVAAREVPPDPRSFFRDRRVEFTLTDAGRKALKPDLGFCYGRAEIVEVIDYTEPSDVGGVPTVKAEARLRRQIDAEWARDPALAELAGSGEQTVEMLLIRKAKSGWSPAY